jgi:hypothetical protein
MEIGQKRPKDASNDVVGKNRIFKATLGPLVYLGLSRTTELKVLQKVVPMLQRKYVFEFTKNDTRRNGQVPKSQPVL